MRDDASTRVKIAVVDPEQGARAERYLQAARETAHWLIRAAIDTPEGPGWPITPGRPETLNATLYGGGAGIALFLSDLASITADTTFAQAAREAALFVARSPDEGYFGLYTGYAGMVLAVNHAAAVLDDADLRSRGNVMLGHLVDAGQPTGDGIEWPAWPSGRGPWQDLYHGTAGIALVAAQLGRPEVAAAAGRRLVELAVPARHGRWWRSRPDNDKPAHNIAHGTAGIAYALATLASVAHEPGFTAAATDGAAYLCSIARTDGGTCAVHHHEVDGTDLYTLGFCSGPPGLACLFVRLHQLTGDASWRDWSLRAARTLTTSGLPARRYPGFWDNAGQCCGSAGVADFFLGLHASTADPAHLEFALVVLDDILDRAVRGEAGMRWHNVEHTGDPPELPAQTGWMQGAAGIGAALLRGHRVLSGSGPGPWLPSWPFPG
jgi:lantibiotic modifying enzyme